ncbi:MAG: AI-2E family transporter [Cyclobacteriaceae bacterium]
MATLIGVVTIMALAKGIIIPLAFAMLFSFILYPPVKWFRQKNVGVIWSIIITMSGVTLLLAGVVYLFSAQIVRMTADYNSFQEELRKVFDTAVSFLNNEINFVPHIKVQTISEAASSFFGNTGFVLVSDTLGFTTTFLSYLTLSIVFTFLILLYSRQLTIALTQFSPEKNRDSFLKMLQEIQKVGQQYLTGILVIVLILGVLNSTGLFLLGIDYAIFFGFLAALLAIIPYVGSFLGGLIPAIYALITYDSLWYPVGVIGTFWVIQFIEGNILNPKIVGGNLRINALFSLISLIGGSILWGIPGMILFLPLTAIIRTVSSYYEELQPLAILIGEEEKEKQEENKWWKKTKNWVKGLLSK